MRLYYHKTDGGAEYLCSSPVKGTTEGDPSFKGSRYVVRIDGDIEKDAELRVNHNSNSHEALVEALKELHNVMEIGITAVKGRTSKRVIMDALSKSRAVLALEKGK